MANNALGVFKTTETAILAFPKALFEPKAFKRNGKEVGKKKYEGTFLHEPESAESALIKKHAVGVAKAKWGSIADVKFPFRNGNTLADKRKAENDAAKAKGEKVKPDGEFQRGKMVIVAKSEFQPQLSGFEGADIVEYADSTIARAKQKLFFGAKVYVEYNFVANEVDGKKSVSVYLNSVLAAGGGKRIGGPQSAADRFSGYKGAMSAEDPTGGEMADEDIAY